MIYLDNAATSYPKPPIVRQRLSEALVKFGANPGRSGHKLGQDTNTAVYEVRKKISDFFGSSGPETVIFFASCTAAINQVLFGKLRSGDHVIVSDIEHNAVMRPLYELAKRGVEFSVAETFPGDNERTVMSFRNLIQGNTKMIVCTAASNVWGMRLPITRLAALAHLYDMEICVDAAQAAGIVPFDVSESEIDYLCFPAHKGLYGIMGLGVLLTQRGKALSPLIFGGTGVNSQSMDQPDDSPERFESGTINVPGIIALGAGIDFVSSKGVDKMRIAELNKADKLYRFLTNCEGVELYMPAPVEPFFVPVLSFTAGQRSDDLRDYLTVNNIAVRTGLQCAPFAHKKMGTDSGTIRVSPSIFTTDEQIAAFNQYIWRFMKNK